MSTWQRAAAMNNAEWCDVVASCHGAETRFDHDAWTSRTRTPPYYPDAVTLVPRPVVADVLSRIDTSPGCSIKDSFATLDLEPYGFRVLFEADWIVRSGAPAPATSDGPAWRRVLDPSGLARWEAAWRGDDGPSGLFHAELLGHPSVAVLAAERHEKVVAGAILNRSSLVVGISNFFARPGAGGEPWAGCLSLAGSLYPGRTIVGYEGADAIADVRRNGFETAGRLRVWTNDPG